MSDIYDFMEVDPKQRMLALAQALRQRQAQQEAEGQRLQGELAGQQQKAGQYRGLGLLNSLGANPLLQGIQRASTAAGDDYQQDARTTMGLLRGTRGGGSDPLRFLSLQQAEERLRQQGTAAGLKADTEAERLKQGQQRIDIASKKAQKMPAGPKAPTLPATEVAALADINVATTALDDLVNTHAALAGGAKGLLGMIPGTEEAKYDDKMNATAQVVGTILEHGKMTDGDLPKYRRMLPDKFDSPSRAAAKRDNVKSLLLQQAAQRKKTFGQAGYNVKGIDVPDIDLGSQPPASTHGQAVNPRDFVRTFEGEKGKFGQSKDGKVWKINPDGTVEPVNVKR